jgi:hypothetical protein
MAQYVVINSAFASDRTEFMPPTSQNIAPPPTNGSR